MEAKLKGLIAAPFTALNPDGSVNLDIINQQAAALAADGVNGAFVCGTTGEGMSLSLPERLQVARRWASVAPPQLSVIIHVGCHSVTESRTLSEAAAELGVRAIATIGPTFFRPARTDQLVDYCAAIAAAAPALPFYYYHIPVMTGVDPPMVDFLGQAVKRIPNFAGIKFTDENLMSYAQCLNFEQGRCNILFGRDEMLLGALALGATGAVGSTYNYIAPLFHSLIAAFERCDLTRARRLQMAAIRIIAVMSRYGGLPAGKAMMKMTGIDCGPVRSPLCNLTASELEQFQSELQGVGFPLPPPGPKREQFLTGER